jgi:hypothetical protein
MRIQNLAHGPDFGPQHFLDIILPSGDVGNPRIHVGQPAVLIKIPMSTTVIVGIVVNATFRI